MAELPDRSFVGQSEWKSYWELNPLNKTLLGIQNTPCGYYYGHNWNTPVDAITCQKVLTDTGTWHLHRYYNKKFGSAYLSKVGWTAYLHGKRV